jgi:hypothetical protein
MKKHDYQDQINRLSKAVNASIGTNGVTRIEQMHDACALLLNWIEHLRQSEVTGTCDEMLLGIRPASVEIAGCISLGLVRPAIFAMRGQIDLALAWLFYKDHRVEWNHVLDVGEGFKLKGEIFEFLTRTYLKIAGRSRSAISVG